MSLAKQFTQRWQPRFGYGADGTCTLQEIHEHNRAYRATLPKSSYDLRKEIGHSSLEFRFGVPLDDAEIEVTGEDLLSLSVTGPQDYLDARGYDVLYRMQVGKIDDHLHHYSNGDLLSDAVRQVLKHDHYRWINEQVRHHYAHLGLEADD